MQLTDYPLFSEGVGTRSREKIERAITLIGEGIAKGEIANAVYEQDVKFYTSRALEWAWEAMITKRFVHRDAPLSDAERDLHYKLPLYPEAHKIAGMRKRVENSGLTTPYVVAMTEFLAEIAPLCTAIVNLKSMAKKRQIRPAEERKPSYTAPKTSSVAEAAILAVLRDVTDRSYEALKASFVGVIQRYLDSYVEASRTKRDQPKYGHHFISPSDYFLHDDRPTYTVGRGELTRQEKINPNQYAAGMVSRCVKQHSYQTPYMVRENAAEIIETEAAAQASAAREMFITKNMLKLVAITESKGDFDRIEIISNDVGLLSMTGMFRITFQDKARFDTKIQTVWSISTRGTEFTRVPVTFHDVVLGDGRALKQPSEQKMNEIFAKAA